MMRVVKNEKGFPAVLKDEQGCILAEGFGSVLEENGEVEFRSDFVPLYPMGVPMEIVRRFEGQDIHVFRGEVYISDKNLLRLIHIRDALVPGSEQVYSTMVSIPGSFSRTPGAVATLEEEEKHPRFSLFRKKKQEDVEHRERYALKLTVLSARVLEFTSAELLDKGDQIYLSMIPKEYGVYLDDLPVQIDKVYAFGEDVAYVASLLPMSSWLAERWKQFICTLNETENRFFPDKPALDKEL